MYTIGLPPSGGLLAVYPLKHDTRLVPGSYNNQPALLLTGWSRRLIARFTTSLYCRRKNGWLAEHFASEVAFRSSLGAGRGAEERWRGDFGPSTDISQSNVRGIGAPACTSGFIPSTFSAVSNDFDADNGYLRMHIRNDKSAAALAWIVDSALLRQSREEGELFPLAAVLFIIRNLSRVPS
jgi:hypothetical protein